ncbi:MAG: histidine kinase [Bacteroidales bacterium]
MIKRILPYFLIIIVGIIEISGQDFPPFENQLQLKKGDVFVYNIQRRQSFVRKYLESTIYSGNPNRKGNITHTTYDMDTRLYLEVLEKETDGCFIFKFKKEYLIYRTESEGVSRTADSRFPEYGSQPKDVVGCFLNTVYYHIHFCASSGKMKVLNLAQIKEELEKYLDIRGVPDSYQREEAISRNLDEKVILDDLHFMDYYTVLQNMKNGTFKRDNGELVSCKIIESTNDYTSYKFVVDNYDMKFDASSPKNKYALIGSFTIDKGSGILMNVASGSYLGKGTIRTDTIFSKRSDIADYSEKIQLKYYSARTQPTWICGNVRIQGVQKVGLFTKERIIGSETSYKEFQKDSSGYFSIPLEIHQNMKYQMHFFKRFPSLNANEPILYIKPGDSIFVTYDSSMNSYGFTGRGFRDSELLNEIKLLPNLDLLFHSINLTQRGTAKQLEYVEGFIKAFEDKQQILTDEKSNISEGFYEYMLSEYESAQEIIKYISNWKIFAQDFLESGNATIDQELLRLPDLPSCPDYHMLQQYDAYISTYTKLRYSLFTYYNTGELPSSIRLPNLPFVDGMEGLNFNKLLLSGVPFYLTIGNMMEELIPMIKHLPVNDYRNFIIDDYMENCNHQESRDHISDLIDRKARISPGSDRPDLNLMDLKGDTFNWEKTLGKVVVLLLYRDYSREHFFSEDLFKEYGENKKDVIILRVSPGINFKKWKAFNERYSTLGHQMYYTDGEHAFKKQFLANDRNGSRYLVIDRNGKIFRNPGGIQKLKGAIHAALNQASPPKTPFFETRAGRSLPGVAIGIILTILIYRIVLIRRARKRELLHRLTSLEHKAIKAQMNPHFLFNCLNSIQNLINKNKQQEANNYLTSFASLIRRFLQYSDKDEVTIHDELETLNIYLELEKLRFNFSSLIDIDPEVDIYNTMIPPMLLQPVVENAILHGLDPKNGEKALKIQVILRSGSILFRIDDNGVGRKSGIPDEKESDSRGLDIIRSRIKFMNVIQPDSYSFKVIDNSDDEGKPTGTTVEIVVPDEK